MTRLRLVSETRRTQYGFTLVEMMIAMVLAGIVMAAVYQLLIGQSRSYGKQRELMDVHGTLRSAATLLAWEIRQSWAAGGDLYSINANSITLRSIQGGGVICGLHATLTARAGLGTTSGDFDATADDSALVYVADTDAWVVGSIDQILTNPVPAGVPWCDWAGGASIVPDVVLEVTFPGGWTQQDFDAYCNTMSAQKIPNCLAAPDWPTFCPTLGWQDEDICKPALAASEASGGTGGTYEVGAPFRAFRRVEYGLYQDAGDGRWWLGRKIGAVASYEKLTGPLLAPASGGLVLTYRDAAGNITADPTQVAVIDFVLRAESYRVSSGAQFQQDTLATRVALRG